MGLKIQQMYVLLKKRVFGVNFQTQASISIGVKITTLTSSGKLFGIKNATTLPKTSTLYLNNLKKIILYLTFRGIDPKTLTVKRWRWSFPSALPRIGTCSCVAPSSTSDPAGNNPDWHQLLRVRSESESAAERYRSAARRTSRR